MSRFLIILLFAATSVLVDAQESRQSVPASPPPAVTPAVKATGPVSSPAAPAEGDARARRDLTYQKRRELGMTPGNINAAIEELRAKGKISDETSDSEVAAKVIYLIRLDHRKAFDAGGYDWEACLGFVEIWYRDVLNPESKVRE